MKSVAAVVLLLAAVASADSQNTSSSPAPSASPPAEQPQTYRTTGARIALVGHSERRQYYNENDTDLAKKVRAALDAGRARKPPDSRLPGNDGRMLP